MNYSLGIDIGSTSVNTVILDENNSMLKEYYDFAYGKPFHILKDRLDEILTEYPQENLQIISFTGTGGKKSIHTLTY